MNVLMCVGPGRPLIAGHRPRPSHSQQFVRAPLSASQYSSAPAEPSTSGAPALQRRARLVQANCNSEGGRANGTQERPAAALNSNGKGASSSSQARQEEITPSEQPTGTERAAYAAMYTLEFLMAGLRRMQWKRIKPTELATNMWFTLAVILVNYGVESGLDHYLGKENPLGSVGCILVGAGVMTYLKLMRIPLSRTLLSGFWN